MASVRTTSLTALLAATLALALTACSGDSPTPTDPADSAQLMEGDFSGLVEVAGRSLHLDCRGTGTPTVILQSGYGNAGDIWSLAEGPPPAVQPAIAANNRVCSYDRPGSTITTTASADGTVEAATALRPGRSDAAPMPRDPAEVVEELHDLLAAAGVPEPYVMVGHSLGGTLTVLYARTYPDQIAGLVIVDSPQPTLRDVLTPEQWELAAMAESDPDSLPGYEIEAYDIGLLFDEIEAAPPPPAVPIIVIQRGETRLGDAPVPDDLAAVVLAINEAQLESQAAFAASVSGAELISVPGTTHYVQTQRPDAVIEAILTVMGR